VADTRVGDTITEDKRPTAKCCPASSRPAGGVLRALPVDAADFEDLRAAMGKLRLNDASFSFEMETSAALGFGFRCGFLGLLHLEIIQERLEPRIQPRPDRHSPVGGLPDDHDRWHEIELHNPADMPDVVKIGNPRSRGSRRPS
jgi:GTP-binding protein LepA